MTYGTHFRITLMEVWKIVSHLLSQISFHCTTYIHYKFHIMDSCCLRHKFNLAATSIADFILDVTDFILTSRVIPMADFILLISLASKVSFIVDTFISDFISFVTFMMRSYITDYISVIPSITDLFQLLPSSRNTFHSLLELYLFLSLIHI